MGIRGYVHVSRISLVERKLFLNSYVALTFLSMYSVTWKGPQPLRCGTLSDFEVKQIVEHGSEEEVMINIDVAKTMC
jgi:hypothetical protein